MCPLALDPKQTFELVLKSDEQKPPNKRPTFIFRYLSNREWKQINAITDEIEEKKKRGATILLEELEGALRLGLVTWRNMIDPKTRKFIPYDSSRLHEIITPSESWELLFGVLSHVGLTSETKKKSESPSPSSTDNSAKTAEDEKTAKPDQLN